MTLETLNDYTFQVVFYFLCVYYSMRIMLHYQHKMPGVRKLWEQFTEYLSNLKPNGNEKRT